MKALSSFLFFALLVVLYYCLWAITLPLAVIKLFVSVAADDDGGNVMNAQRG